MLRQRLGARPAPQTHPDPDLLAAYTEQALTEAERLQVVQHLAECGDCREVVSLSLPQQPPEQVVIRPAVQQHSRLWLPAFRWTAVAATLAIAATLLVEKPWKHANPAQNVQQLPPVVTQPVSAQPATPAPSNTDNASSAKVPAATSTEPVKQTDRGLEPQANLAAARPQPRIPEVRTENGPLAGSSNAGGLVDGVVQPVPAAPPMVRPQVTTSAHRLVTEAKDKNGSAQDYVNTSFLDNATANGNGRRDQTSANETVEVSAQAPVVETTNGGAAAFPQAPAPKTTVAGQPRGGPSAPPLNANNTGNRFDIAVAPPATAAAPPAPEKSDNSLANQSGFAMRMSKKVASAVRKMAQPHSSEQPGIAFAGSGAGTNAASPLADDANTEFNSRTSASQQLHWRINPDGILMKSTDLSQWHEAYPQGAELQFKTVFSLGMGRQVWAGGNNGTLIHSWNAGVNWDTLKVPEAGASDITSISIDDGWQIKTSDGQTFVSHDQGKTWVPLKQDQK